MKFEEAMVFLRQGKRIRRESWANKRAAISLVDRVHIEDNFHDHILAEDWEVMPELIKKTVWVNMFLIDNAITAIGTYSTKDEAEFHKQTLNVWLGAFPVTVVVSA
jgi:hypothetical protein